MAAAFDVTKPRVAEFAATYSQKFASEGLAASLCRARTASARALEQGQSAQQIADQISTDYAFSPERATVVARTETACAFVERRATWLGRVGRGAWQAVATRRRRLPILPANRGQRHRQGLWPQRTILEKWWHHLGWRRNLFRLIWRCAKWSTSSQLPVRHPARAWRF